jgi:ABC-type uncharacterized transport system substrate-binding protein
MRRRDLIALASGMAVACGASPGLPRAQGVMRRIAFVHSGIPAAQLTEMSDTFWVRRFFAELRSLGYLEGSNLAVERYSAEGQPDRFGALAAEIASRRPDVIVANQNPLVKALRQASEEIPIVAIVGDPIGFGLVESLAHPGGNITGVSVDAGIEIYGKRLQILKEVAPAAGTIAYLGLPGDWMGQIGQAMRDAGRDLQVSIVNIAPPDVTATSLHATLSSAAEQGIGALVVSGAGDFLAHRELIVNLAARAHLVAMYPYRDYVDAGGLMTYAPELGDLAQHLAHDVQQVLQGAKPADIPIYQAAKFELVINLKTAKALGLTVPQSLLARADEVIE